MSYFSHRDRISASPQEEFSVLKMAKHREEEKSLPKSLQQIEFSEIKIGKKIGSGGFGKVYEGTWQQNKIAIKN